MHKFRYLFHLILLCSVAAKAQHRIVTGINTGWKFHKGSIEGYPEANPGNEVLWEQVNLPHSWNKTDVLDDEKGYYRGAGWYVRQLHIPPSWQDKDVNLYFEGASQVTEVYINGKKAGQHTGGYTFFNIPVRRYLSFEPGAVNTVMVKVDNSHDENIPPLSADFTFFGGIYRDVYLIATDAVHFDLDNNASPGIFITTPKVSDASADVKITGNVVNKTASLRSISVITRIADRYGKIVARQETSLKVPAGQKMNFKQDISNIKKPDLWSPGDPCLYQVTSVLTDAKTKQPLDQVTNPLGFRWFNFDPEQGFFLNGKPVKLIGASRHQDYKDMANALPDAMHVKDVELLKNMGANFIRIAHYPQDPEILQACDRLGLLASVEIPVVNGITMSEEFARNCKTMQVEMIRQNFNHPSVIIWAYMNEVLLRIPYPQGSEQQRVYIEHVAKLAQQLEDITRKEDPSRYTMIPNHGNFELYHKAGLTQIPRIVGWNIYSGWYSGDLSGFAKFLDHHHQVLPGKPLLVTEYGADADPRLHSFEPVRFDKSEEYALIYHKAYLKAIRDRPFVVGGAIWNLADFSSEQRAESMPHINNKGITTIDRKPKAIYWFYKASLWPEPFVAIGSKRWALRSGVTDSDSLLQCTQPVEVYSNQPLVTLKLNGREIGTLHTTTGTARFMVPFTDGENRLEAVTIAGSHSYQDEAVIDFKLIPLNLKSKQLPFKELNVSLGDQRYFVDDKLQQVWLPEQPYRQGGWGYTGGEVFVMKGSSRLSYGSDINILGTEYDPLFETQRIGIEQFRLYVPDGSYTITLHFAELMSGEKADDLVYNLSGNTLQTDKITSRQFDVSINDIPVLEGLSNNSGLEPGKAYSCKTIIAVTGGNGIIIRFKSQRERAILNGLQVSKIF